MSRSRTLLQLRLEVRQRADMVNSSFVTDSEVDRCVNQSWARMYDMLLATGEDYYLKYVDVTTPVAGFYDLPLFTSSTGTVASDVYQIRGVDANYSGNVMVNLPRFSFEERNLYLAAPALTPYYPIVAYRFMQNPTTQADALEIIPSTSTGVTNLRVWYYPNPQVLTMTATVTDTTTVFTNGTYTNVPLTGGTGTGLLATVVIAATNLFSVTITNPGAGYGPDSFTWGLAAAAVHALSPAVAVGGVVSSSSLDGRSGWDEWVVVDAATKLLTKEESDTTQLERENARIWQHITLAAQNRDSGQSKRIVDTSYNTGMWPYTGAGFRR